MTSIFGVKIALSDVIVGIILAVIGGSLSDKLGMDKNVEQYIKSDSVLDIEAPKLSKRDRAIFAKNIQFSLLKRYGSM